MRHLMRDDVLGLSRFRTLPTTGTDRLPAAPQRALAPQAPTTSNFASALNRATQARAQVHQPYASPLKQSAASQAAASHRPTTTHPTTRTPSSPRPSAWVSSG